MASIEPPAIQGTRGILVHMGLGSPVARAFVAGTVVGVLAYALKAPSMCFDEEGQMRPLKGASKAPTATYAHFLAVPVSAAALAFVFT